MLNACPRTAGVLATMRGRYPYPPRWIHATEEDEDDRARTELAREHAFRDVRSPMRLTGAIRRRESGARAIVAVREGAIAIEN